MWWKDSITKLSGVGIKRAADLERLGIATIGDLLYFYPRQGAYLDYSEVKTIRDLVPDGSKQLFKAKIFRINNVNRGKRSFVTITVYDNTGYADLYLFAGQRFLGRKFKPEDEVLISGRVKAGRLNKMVSPELLQAFDGDGTTPGILPVYSLTGSLTQNVMRKLVHEALTIAEQDLPESLPKRVLQKTNFLPRTEALKNIHFPVSKEKLNKARQRFIFEELFLLQCGLLYYRQGMEAQRAWQFANDGIKVQTVIKNLPFDLTDAQKKVWNEIAQDLETSRPMHRILQGDVGSGKTAVAALALVKAAENGYQSCIMAPTEILARQHFETLSNYLQPAGIKIGLLVGGMHKRAQSIENGVCSSGDMELWHDNIAVKQYKYRDDLLQDLRNGEIDVLVGTHALLQDDVVFKALALVVTDEQHRFGVEQRAKLVAKGEIGVHTLVMTATPIPRTLALTVYGDLDISKMEGLPPGRKPIKTLLYSEQQREAVYKGIRHQAELGHQVYVVCPLVEDSEEVVARSVEQVYLEMKETVLKGISTALIHGKMKSLEKDAIMTDFANGKISVLFSTTVIEVGVNVPNATLMVVENAERFGLAQLHQLRGRVGRGTEQSFCALMVGTEDSEAIERLQILASSEDGFYLAEQDLRLRGAGQLFGLRQHGLPDLHIADILRDTDIIVEARKMAQECVSNDTEREEIKQLVQMQLDERFQMIFNS
ncbi:MAG: ATP-dependent DNA helicase RecG [Phascolarctobacterium sp.]|nr:ATP-dependent DNA helicase RecG [Candidatus Phascolarctobacterium caballi]